MIIFLNDKAIEITQNTDLQTLLKEQLHITPEKKGIAVAVNEQIIPRHQWKEYTLQQNDRILVITAAQGG